MAVEEATAVLFCAAFAFAALPMLEGALLLVLLFVELFAAILMPGGPASRAATFTLLEALRLRMVVGPLLLPA